MGSYKIVKKLVHLCEKLESAKFSETYYMPHVPNRNTEKESIESMTAHETKSVNPNFRKLPLFLSFLIRIKILDNHKFLPMTNS